MSMLATTPTASATASSTSTVTRTNSLLSDTEGVKQNFGNDSHDTIIEAMPVKSGNGGYEAGGASRSNRSSTSSAVHLGLGVGDNAYSEIINPNSFSNESASMAMTYLSTASALPNNLNTHASQTDLGRMQYLNYPIYPALQNSLHYTSYDTTATGHNSNGCMNSTIPNSSVAFGSVSPQHFNASAPVNFQWYSGQSANHSNNAPINNFSNQDLSMDFEKLYQYFKCHENSTVASNPSITSHHTDIESASVSNSNSSSIQFPASVASSAVPLKSLQPDEITRNNKNNNNNNNRISDLSVFSKGTLVTNPNSPEYLFNSPQFDLQKEIPTLVKLAHRNKDIKLSDTQDESKREEFQKKLLKKIKRKRQASYATKTLSGILQNPKNNLSLSSTVPQSTKAKRTIGRPLTPKTKVRLTLVPNLPTLYSMLVTDSIDLSELKSQLSSFSPASSSSSSSSPSDSWFLKVPSLNKNIREKFRVLKRGNVDDGKAYEELLFNESVDWRFKTSSASDSNPPGLKASDSFENGLQSGGGFPGKTQAVTFLDTDDNDDEIKIRKARSPLNEKFANAIGIDEDNSLVYTSVDTAIREIFGLREYTFLRITRAAAFEKTGSVVLKMETIKPGYRWLDDDEFDLKIMFKMFGGENLDDVADCSNDFSNQFGKPGDPITTTFLKKKVARPRYKSNMRIYLIPRSTDAILYTRESMLKRDIINGTLDLNDKEDPRMIITAFEFENVLRELRII